MYENVVKEYFPYKSARKGQLEAINDCLNALDSYDYVILDAPTGMGKTSVARTLAEYYSEELGKDSFILTSTKMLQEQYYDECKDNENMVDYKVAKGRSNFYCHYLGNGITCNRGECKETTDTKFKCMFGMQGSPTKNGGCAYWVQKANAIFSDVAIMNYDVLLSDFGGHYKDRYFMVCDEAHNIDNKIMNRIGLTLNEKTLNKLLSIQFKEDDYEISDIEYWIERLEELNSLMKKHIENPELYTHTINETERLQRMSEQITSRLKDIRGNKDFWFVYGNNFENKIMIKPRDVSYYVKSVLLNKADEHLFMSGSIVNKDNFIKYMGLDDDEVFYIKAKSSFDIKNNNPIIPRYCGSLTYNQKHKTLPKTYTEIMKILQEHTGEKGIIHCNSREFRNKIMDNVPSSRLISYDTSEEKEDMLKEFTKSDYDDVIVAYSLEEGVDLPYDNISFQIIFKVPYPYLGDPQVRARKDYDKNWYIIETIRKLIQTQGRGMRAVDDKCTNYVLDSSFKGIIRNKLCPKEFKECVL